MPVWLFKWFVSKELVAMWQWLSQNSFAVHVETVHNLHPNVLNMERWLEKKK